MLERILGVFKLDANTFEAIEKDERATGQAALIVLIAAILTGVASLFTGWITATTTDGNVSSAATTGFLGTAFWVLLGWVIWSAVSYFVGTTFFGGKATLSEMLRVIGFAYAPQFLGIIPCVGFIGVIWSLAAGFVAVRQGLDLDNVKAFLTIVIGFVVYIAGYVLIALLTGLATGMGANLAP